MMMNFRIMKNIDAAGGKLFVVSSGSFEILGLMRKASGLSFNYYISDRDVLYKIMEQNTGVIFIRNGIVVAKYNDEALPVDATFLTQLEAH